MTPLIVSRLLKMWHELDDVDPELVLDLTNAIRGAGLSQEEHQALHAVHLAEPVPPKREDRSGRPTGGSTQVEIAKALFDREASDNAKAIQLNRVLWGAYEKVSAWLGEGYEVV